MSRTENSSPVDAIDGERRAVERDRAFFGDEARERVRARDDKAAMPSKISTATIFADAVDMAGDDMAAEFVADLQRPFEIEFGAGLPAPAVVRASVSAPTSTSNQVAGRLRRARPR